MELAKLQTTSPAPPTALAPERKGFPQYHPNDCVIAYLDSFKEACRDYQIPVAEYTRNLRAYMQGPLLEVLVEFQDSEAQGFAKCEQLVHAQFALTPELARTWFLGGGEGPKRDLGATALPHTPVLGLMA